jgi:hypothetical protein
VAGKRDKVRASLRIIICLALVSLARALACAQTSDVGEREFESAVNQYTEVYQDLRLSRGLSAVSLPGRARAAALDPESLLLRGAAPLTVKYSRASSLPAFTEALRSKFAPGAALLFYAYRNETLQVWLIDRDGLRAYSSRPVTRQQLDSAIYDLRSSLGVDSLQSSRAPSPLNVSPPPVRQPPDVRLKKTVDSAIGEMTDVLLPPPVAEHLNSVRHLIVAPILGVGTVPFAILRPFKSDTFLIEKMSVSVAPNLFDVEDDTPAWTPRYKNPLVIGNPYFPRDANWRVPPLPGAEDEARAIGKMINARAVVGRRATKRAVLARAARADFLYFATHGIASSDNPLVGGFLFLTARTLTRGFWTAQEIQSSRLRAQIAVLSACQTGLGRIHDAGVIGLSRAFQIAGVPRVVMSLWSVNDQATAELMKAFVKHLRSNMPSEALRLAMLEVRRTRPQLSHWASFVLFGTPR